VTSKTQPWKSSFASVPQLLIKKTSQTTHTQSKDQHYARMGGRELRTGTTNARTHPPVLQLPVQTEGKNVKLTFNASGAGAAAGAWRWSCGALVPTGSPSRNRRLLLLLLGAFLWLVGFRLLFLLLTFIVIYTHCRREARDTNKATQDEHQPLPHAHQTPAPHAPAHEPSDCSCTTFLGRPGPRLPDLRAGDKDVFLLDTGAVE
jgi:hypothetical protein